MSNQETTADPVEAAASSHPLPNKAKKTSKGWLIVIPILFSLLGLLIGSAIGVVGFRMSKANYESKCKIWLMELEKGNAVPHHEMIVSRSMIQQALDNDNNNLRQLSTLRDLASQEGIDFVQERLSVESWDEGNQILTLRYVSPNPMDTQVVLMNLVSTYWRSLNEAREPESEDEPTLKILESGERGKALSRDPVGFIGYRALIGLVIGFLVGAVFSLILKC